ncbi:hypothetical protein EMIT0324P_60218 [Pseudomonas chlororaphis]
MWWMPCSMAIVFELQSLLKVAIDPGGLVLAGLLWRLYVGHLRVSRVPGPWSANPRPAATQ